jgi:hypothetical protein
MTVRGHARRESRVLGEMLAEFVAFTLPDLHAEVDRGRDLVFLVGEARCELRIHSRWQR